MYYSECVTMWCHTKLYIYTVCWDYGVYGPDKETNTDTQRPGTILYKHTMIGTSFSKQHAAINKTKDKI